MLISHDIGVISAMSDRVVVMYSGAVVEEGWTGDLLADPRHPYSRLLLDTYVDIDMPPVRPLPTIAGMMPWATQCTPGCRFSARCPECIALCNSVKPALEAAGADHRVACHRWQDLLAARLRSA